MVSLEPDFKKMVVAIFGEASKTEDWLAKEGLLAKEDFGLLATDEKDVTTVIVPVAKAGGVPTEALLEQVRFKKLWKACRVEDRTLVGLADSSESDVGLDERVRRTCEQTWQKRHGFTIPAGRLLVSTQMAPMHQMAHAAQRDFSLLPLRRMRLQDGSIPSHAPDSQHVIFLKIRAFWYSWAFVCLDVPEFFNLGAAERVIDKMLVLLHAKHAAGTPPSSFFADAWDSTARVLQDAVRNGKTLVTATEADGTYQHLWAVFVQGACAQNPPGKQPHQVTPDGIDGELSEVMEGARNMQKPKDNQINALRREVEMWKGWAQGPEPKKGKWGKW